ncbi:MAG TPA: glycogen debranching enzyme, partial [Thermoanaerobaculia bacterium]|nr:glycogen debranching enzyme [Thermoanaerobaculia bacterium]
TLFTSQGVPMLLGGDEIGRTQHGNNNAYCQDNEISWFDWENVDDDLMTFVAHVIEFRKEHPVFTRRRWFLGRPLRGADVSDIGWFKPDGEQMSDDDWQSGFARSVGVFLNGRAIPTPDGRGEPIVDDSFYILYNAHYEAIRFRLPIGRWGDHWLMVIDTNEPVPDLREQEELRAGEELSVQAYSVVVLRRVD